MPSGATRPKSLVPCAWLLSRAPAPRPTASTVGSGAMFYDTTLSKPIFSDGSTWRDAAGTAV